MRQWLNSRSAFCALLCAVFLVSDATGQESDDRAAKARRTFDELTRSYETARTAWGEKIRAFASSEEYKKLRAEKKFSEASAFRNTNVRLPHLDLLPLFEAAARNHEGQPSEADFLIWMVKVATNAPPPDASQKRALKRLLSVHIDNPRIEPLVTAGDNAGMYRLLGYDEFVRVLGDVAARTKVTAVKAHALFCRAIFRRDVRPKDRDPLTDADRAAIEKDLRLVADLLPGSNLALRARAREFQKQRLGIGMTAPDIVGKDLDGVAFKLSDYRGKVVLLDFWGDW